MKLRWFCLALMIATVVSLLSPSPAAANHGTPNSPDFGYGVNLDLGGQTVLESLQSAARLNVDWVKIEIDWAARWPDANQQPNLGSLDAVMEIAAVNRIAVLISLTSAPRWASTQQGPDAQQTAWFLSNLARRYPDTLQAVEIYPSANTQAGWGAAPDPALYAQILAATRAALAETGLPIFIVAGGLAPLTPQPLSGDIDDLFFLQALYQLGAIQPDTIVSMVFDELTGEPLKSPDSGDHRVLRHYEEVRQVMLANGHTNGLIWVTQFSWPTGKISPDDVSYKGNAEGQSKWLAQSFQQLRAQLYIGAAFVNQLNPANGGADEQSLIRANATLHPFMSALRDIIQQNNLAEISSQPKFTGHQSKHITKLRLSP